MDKFEEMLKKSLEYEPDFDKCAGHFSRYWIPLLKRRFGSYSVTERFRENREEYNEKYLKDKNE